MAVGYIYVLSNPLYPGLVKVGLTKESAEQRAQQLFTTGVPQPFRVEYYQLTDDVQEVEGLVHRGLGEISDARVGSDREFFRVSIKTAVLEIEKHVRTPSARFLRAPFDISTRTCRHCGTQVDLNEGERYTYCPKCGK